MLTTPRNYLQRTLPGFIADWQTSEMHARLTLALHAWQLDAAGWPGEPEEIHARVPKGSGPGVLKKENYYLPPL